MTISYNLSVSTSHPWTFFKLLFRWRGSVWKGVWQQYVVWFALYLAISLSYRLALTELQKEQFTNLATFLKKQHEYIPLDLLLGFYITAVLDRWKYLYNIIGWIDNIGLYCSMYIRGNNERAKMYRRNIIRHCCLVQVLVFRDLSAKTKKRVPTLDTVQAAGFMSSDERVIYDEMQYAYPKYFLPFNWAWSLVYRARKEGYIESDYFQVELSDEIKKFRTDLAWLCNYDACPLPLIYPTIVCFIVHLYFLVAAISRQFTTEDTLDLYFPLMTTLQFFLYMGWLKAAEELLNPWGEDDDDFETNTLIDRNLIMGLKIVDNWGNLPDQRRDPFWDEGEWVPMYSEETVNENRRKQSDAEPSASHVKLCTSKSYIRMVPLQRDRRHSIPSMHHVKIVPVKQDDVDVEIHERPISERLRRWSRSFGSSFDGDQHVHNINVDPNIDSEIKTQNQRQRASKLDPDNVPMDIIPKESRSKQ